MSHMTGVVYSHQCGGLACYQRELQGYLVPLAFSLPLCQELYTHFYIGPKYKGNCYNGLDIADAELIDRLLASIGFESLTVDRSKLSESAEAWVYLNLDPSLPSFPFCANSDSTATIVLIWENSD